MTRGVQGKRSNYGLHRLLQSQKEYIMTNGNLKPGSRQFMGRLLESIEDPETDPLEEIRGYAPQQVRQVVEKMVEQRMAEVPMNTYREPETATRTRNQRIAELIVALPYREAITMGAGIAEKLKNGVEAGKDSGLSPEFLTRAIQDWAWEWEGFKD
jgi:hypothetical protein